jgi:hypothetical protein
MNIAYRWFLGYTLNEELPHFSTVSYNFKHRFTEETVEKVFSWILQEANRAGYLAPEAVFVDGTHIKANANINKKIKKAVPQAAKRYASELMEEVNADRKEHGKKPFDSTQKPPKEKEITVSKTDPESGLFQKGEHKKCFAYEAHTACDKHNFVLGETRSDIVPDRVLHGEKQYYVTVEETEDETKAPESSNVYVTPSMVRDVLTTYCPFS